MPDSRLFAGGDYLKALKKHYPGWLKSGPDLFGFVGKWLAAEDRLGEDQTRRHRFSSPSDHTFSTEMQAWKLSTRGSGRCLVAARNHAFRNSRCLIDLITEGSALTNSIALVEFE